MEKTLQAPLSFHSTKQQIVKKLKKNINHQRNQNYFFSL